MYAYVHVYVYAGNAQKWYVYYNFMTRNFILMKFIYINLFLSPPGKNWHAPKQPFRPKAGQTSYAKRVEMRKHHEAVKEQEREMKEEKEAEKNVNWTRLK